MERELHAIVFMGSAYSKGGIYSEGMHTCSSLGAVFEFCPPQGSAFPRSLDSVHSWKEPPKLVALNCPEHCKEPYFAHSSFVLTCQALGGRAVCIPEQRENVSQQ